MGFLNGLVWVKMSTKKPRNIMIPAIPYRPIIYLETVVLDLKCLEFKVFLICLISTILFDLESI